MMDSCIWLEIGWLHNNDTMKQTHECDPVNMGL